MKKFRFIRRSNKARYPDYGAALYAALDPIRGLYSAMQKPGYPFEEARQSLIKVMFGVKPEQIKWDRLMGQLKDLEHLQQILYEKTDKTMQLIGQLLEKI